MSEGMSALLLPWIHVLCRWIQTNSDKENHGFYFAADSRIARIKKWHG